MLLGKAVMAVKSGIHKYRKDMKRMIQSLRWNVMIEIFHSNLKHSMYFMHPQK